MSLYRISDSDLELAVRQVVNDYINTVGEENIHHLHELVLEQIEPPLLEMVIKKVNYNQSKAAKLLGLSRGTLRKKLMHYFGNKYCTGH